NLYVAQSVGQFSTVGGTVALIAFTINATAPGGSTGIYIVPSAPINQSYITTTVLSYSTSRLVSSTLGTRPTAQNYPTFVAGMDGIVYVSGASHFVINTPSNISAGTPFAWTVVAEDAINNTATGYTGTVSLASSDSRAV